MKIVIWSILVILVTYYGDTRKLGWGWTLFWAVLLGPLIGFIIAACYPKKD